ncbi:MAG: hypothetical protein QOK40_2594 [Miltoncostaeaceae bacterium]|nr:hypothetical protein [Miltoncostaeaceae bacterium]
MQQHVIERVLRSKALVRDVATSEVDYRTLRRAMGEEVAEAVYITGCARGQRGWRARRRAAQREPPPAPWRIFFPDHPFQSPGWRQECQRRRPGEVAAGQLTRPCHVRRLLRLRPGSRQIEEPGRTPATQGE